MVLRNDKVSVDNNAIPVSRREFLVMECLKNGMVKAQEIIKETKINYTTVMQILFEFKEVGWVTHDLRNHTYALAEDVTFKPMVTRNNNVKETIEEEKKMRRERTILKATYQNERRELGFVDLEVKISYWTPEQIAEHEKKITAGKVIEKPTKKGAKWGESGHPFFRFG